MFKDKIIQKFIAEANKSLNTPVNIEKIDVSIFERFPQLSIVLQNVSVEDSHPGKYPLLTAKTVSFQLNPIEVWNGVYVIKGLQIQESETNLKLDKTGKANYIILKENQSAGKGKGALRFELKNVGLKKTRVRYLDLLSAQELIFDSESLQASITSSDDNYFIEAKGEVITEKISIRGTSVLEGKQFSVNSKLQYDDGNKSLLIEPSDLLVQGSSFTVEGSYSWRDKNYINLKTVGSDTDVQTILSLLPEEVSGDYRQYRSKGDVYFSALLKGEISKKKNPGLSIEFGFREATIFHPESRAQLEHVSMEGSFATPDVTRGDEGVLILKNIQGVLNEEKVTGNLAIHNLNDPEVKSDFKGIVDAAWLAAFYPMKDIDQVTGKLNANVSFEGKVSLLKKRSTAQRVSTTGTIDLSDINLTYGKDKIPLEHLNGSLQFNNNDLALSNVSGKLGNSDFVLNGFFKNVITFLLFENQPIGIEADLKSNYIDLNQLFALGFGSLSAGSEQSYAFSISKNINLNFNCDVKGIRYKRFYGRFLTGDLLVKNEMAISRNIQVKTMGGDLNFSGIVDAQNQKVIDVVNSFKLNGIHIDSVFYVFENFKQSFIEDKHLKGKVQADVTMEMALHPDLTLFQETLVADISAVIKQGELNNFEPLQKLKKYVNDDELSRLRFSDLKNEIHIENKTVYIPQMEVKTNVTSLKISGTHTFDQHIDYRVITPLRRDKNVSLEAKDAIEEDATGQSKLYLKIIGTTDNYKVMYDTEAVKKKIITDLKNEVKELKDAFKNKGTQKKKELELEEDEYFDWEE